MVCWHGLCKSGLVGNRLTPAESLAQERCRSFSIEDCRVYFVDGVQERDTPPISAVCEVTGFSELHDSPVRFIRLEWTRLKMGQKRGKLPPSVTSAIGKAYPSHFTTHLHVSFCCVVDCIYYARRPRSIRLFCWRPGQRAIDRVRGPACTALEVFLMMPHNWVFFLASERSGECASMLRPSRQGPFARASERRPFMLTRTRRAGQ